MLFTSASEGKEAEGMRTTFMGFSHRLNEDGTYDAICLRCFCTVANEGSEQALKLFEASHHCEKLEREAGVAASTFPQ